MSFNQAHFGVHNTMIGLLVEHAESLVKTASFELQHSHVLHRLASLSASDICGSLCMGALELAAADIQKDLEQCSTDRAAQAVLRLTDAVVLLREFVMLGQRLALQSACPGSSSEKAESVLSCVSERLSMADGDFGDMDLNASKEQAMPLENRVLGDFLLDSGLNRLEAVFKLNVEREGCNAVPLVGEAPPDCWRSHPAEMLALLWRRPMASTDEKTEGPTDCSMTADAAASGAECTKGSHSTPRKSANSELQTVSAVGSGSTIASRKDSARGGRGLSCAKRPGGRSTDSKRAYGDADIGGIGGACAAASGCAEACRTALNVAVTMLSPPIAQRKSGVVRLSRQSSPCLGYEGALEGERGRGQPDGQAEGRQSTAGSRLAHKGVRAASAEGTAINSRADGPTATMLAILEAKSRSNSVGSTPCGAAQAGYSLQRVSTTESRRGLNNRREPNVDIGCAAPMELVHLPVLHRCVAQSDTASTFGRSGLTRSNIRAAIESAQVSSANGINMSADDAQPAVAAPVERPQLLSGTSLATCAQSGEGEKCRAPSRGRGAGAERGTGRDPMSLVVKAAGQGSATGPERQTAPLPLAASCAEFATSRKLSVAQFHWAEVRVITLISRFSNAETPRQ
uniref:Uncharacterized protein n=2 Tax=Chrysotila carterae TaxID=13221 RepID=A0A7S4BA26_CHRCT